MATNKKPGNTLRCGDIKTTIWHNVSEKGPFFATTFSRPFKDQVGVWRNGTSFGLHEAALRAMSAVLASRCVVSCELVRSLLDFFPGSASVISVAMW